MNFLNIQLPKWPACLVKGKPVTPEQAEEIIIRTDDFRFSTNDRKWKKELIESLSIPYTDAYPYYNRNDMDYMRKKFNILELEYLSTERIASSYIYGPNGWIDWDGNIYQTNKNIGKWATVGEVFDEWSLIAEAFPYLELTCQLCNNEYCEKESPLIPLIQFDIKNGKVDMSIPDKILFTEIENPLHAFNWKIRNEKGCDINKFRKALQTTMNNNPNWE